MALIVVAGDALVDIFEDTYRAGGATNVYENLDAITMNTHLLPLTQLFEGRGHIWVDFVYNKELGKVFYDANLQIYKKEDSVQGKLLHRLNQDRLATYREKDYCALIISDYSRGSVTPCDPTDTIIYEPPPWDLIVVDSRYRTVDPLLLRQAPDHCLKVWHCTGDEYDYEFAKQFDVLLHTNGPKEVAVISGLRNKPGQQSLYKFQVPQDTPVANTSGAGDTFVAAWAAHYVKNKSIYDATEFAISAAQDVIQEPYTAVTKHKI
jgi:hypothetical protein